MITFRYQMRLLLRDRLAVNARLAPVISEGGRGDLAAGVAVDAARVDEEIPRNVLGQATIDVCHQSSHRR